MDTSAAASLKEEGSGPIYQALPGIYDEMMGLGTQIGPAWQTCASWFQGTNPAVQMRYAQKVERLVFENFNDPQRDRHAWRLDLMPVVLDQSTWSLIEQAAIQRARLYNNILADLYGEQTLFNDGAVPPTLVLNDTSYLRPLHGVQPEGGHLTFMALDFARDETGNWRIIDTHTETPAGHGFALANRMVISEVIGPLFRRTGALRIGDFYQRLSDDVLRRAQSEDPVIAVLAPRPGGSGFVGHSFMARYMGQMRVEGSDLRVVGNRVYLKTIKGLKKLDLLVRAIEGHLADPLELAPDGFDGPVGLVEACRQAPDLIVNALGTAVVENRGLSGYLPNLAQRFLGEDLIVPDTPRLWLGDAAARESVLASLDDHIIHDAQEGTGAPGQAMQGRSSVNMTPQQRAALESDIRFKGPLLVAEQPMGFATAPGWTPEGLQPQRFAVRVYIAAIDGQFSVMPGGLALAVDAGTTVALSSRDGRSRDVWVVSDQQAAPNITVKRVAAHHATVQRHAQGLQSRVADNLFWLGRYCERADVNLRVMRQSLRRSAADSLTLSTSQHPCRALLAILEQDETGMNGQIPVNAGQSAMWGALRELCTAKQRMQALPRTFENIRNVAVQCRDRLSEDSWRILTGLSADEVASRLPATPAEGQEASDSGIAIELDIIEAADDLIDRLAAFNGMTHENMTRAYGWLFLDLGRRIERAHQLSTLLMSLFPLSDGEDSDNDDMIFALQAADSFITFRSRYRFAPEMHLVLDLLVIDETNPRSLAYQLAAIADHIGKLPKSADDAMRTPDQRLILELLTKVRLADVEKLSQLGPDRRRTELAELLGDLIKELPHLSELISRQYFSLADEQPRRLHPNSDRA